MMMTRAVKGKNTPDQKILEQDREFQVRIASLRKQVDSLTGLGDRAPKGLLPEAQKKLDQAQADYERFIREIKQQGGELSGILTCELPRLKEVQAVLPEDKTLLEYFTGQEKSYAWLVTQRPGAGG